MYFEDRPFENRFLGIYALPSSSPVNQINLCTYWLAKRYVVVITPTLPCR